MVPPIIVPKTIVYGTLLVSIQIEKNTIQIQFQNSLPKINIPNILVIYNMLGMLILSVFWI